MWGVGPRTATEFWRKGYKSLQQLRDAAARDPKLLTAQQRIGIKYYSEFLQRIPRPETQAIEATVVAAANAVLPGVTAITCGSYRRYAHATARCTV